MFYHSSSSISICMHFRLLSAITFHKTKFKWPFNFNRLGVNQSFEGKDSSKTIIRTTKRWPRSLKDDLQSVMRTLESLFAFLVSVATTYMSKIQISKQPPLWT